MASLGRMAEHGKMPPPSRSRGPEHYAQLDHETSLKLPKTKRAHEEVTLNPKP